MQLKKIKTMAYYSTFKEDEAYRDGKRDAESHSRDYLRNEHAWDGPDKAYWDGYKEQEREEQRREERQEEERMNRIAEDRRQYRSMMEQQEEDYWAQQNEQQKRQEDKDQSSLDLPF